MQCKSSNTEKNLNRLAVTDAASGYYKFTKKFPEIKFRKIAITNQFFNSEAVRLANDSEVELLERNHLAELLEQYHYNQPLAFQL